MPWLKNNQVDYTGDIATYKYAAKEHIRTALYRSRNPLDPDLFWEITMPFQLDNLPDITRDRTNRFKTVAMPRGENQEDTYYTIKNIVSDMRGNNLSRVITIFNTNNNQGHCPYVIAQLKEAGWQEQDYRTALSCNPFHTTVVLVNTGAGLTEPHVLIFTNELSDEFICKIGAILPIIYNIEIPEDMTQAYLEGDKAKFITAWNTIIGPMITARARKETTDALALLQQWENTHAVTALNDDILRKQRDITDREEQLRAVQRTLQDLLIRQASTYWGTAAQSITEFTEYLTQYELNTITKAHMYIGDGVLQLQLITKLLYWDEELFKNYEVSARENCVTLCDAPMRALLRNIFLDKTVEVTFHTGIKLYLSTEDVSRDTNYLPDGASPIGIAHSHIYYHNCWGNNKAPIVGALNRKDYLVAWAQIKSTLSGLNLADSTVFNRFVNQLTETSVPCLTIKGTKEYMTPTAFIKKYPEGYIVPIPEADIAATVEETAIPRKRTRKNTTTTPVVEVNPFD